MQTEIDYQEKFESRRTIQVGSPSYIDETGNSARIYHNVIELKGKTRINSGNTNIPFKIKLPAESRLEAKSKTRFIQDRVLAKDYKLVLTAECAKSGPNLTGSIDLAIETSMDIEQAA